MADLVIFGTGDIARLAHVYFTTDSPHRVAAFTVDAAFMQGDEFRGLPLVPFEEIARHYPPDRFQMFVALSYAKMNRIRAEKYIAAKQLGYALPSYVSSRCSWLTDAPVGENCFILEDNTIQPFVKIGHNVTLWSGNHIGHDSEIGDHTFISSHVVVSGHCKVGRYCFLGVNATLRNSITIGDKTLLGAGAVITKNTPEGSVWIPATSTKFAKSSDDVKL